VAEVVVELPDALRSDLKAPFGEIYTDADALLADAADPIVAVGDVVTYHLVQAGRTPDVALVDERTKRTQVDAEITRGIGGFDREVVVDNPAATLTAGLLDALATAIHDGSETLIHVEGEEDLAVLPAIVLPPAGASVVYGQPDEGMVLVDVDGPAVERVRALLSKMDGDTGRLWAALGVEN